MNESLIKMLPSIEDITAHVSEICQKCGKLVSVGFELPTFRLADRHLITIYQTTSIYIIKIQMFPNSFLNFNGNIKLKYPKQALDSFSQTSSISWYSVIIIGKAAVIV